MSKAKMTAVLRGNGKTTLLLPDGGEAEWKRELSDEECKSLASNPWQLFKAPLPPTKAPRFPTMLRKQWGGHEVQAWIDDHWTAPPQEALAIAAQRLEDACNKRAALLTQQAYLDAEAIPGMREVLDELDSARNDVRAALAAPSTPAEPGVRKDGADLIRSRLVQLLGKASFSHGVDKYSAVQCANELAILASHQGAPSTPAAPTQCACGVPWTLGVVHRAKNPCFVYIEPTAQPDVQHEPWCDQSCDCGAMPTKAKEPK